LRDIVTFIAGHDRRVAESFGYRLMARVDLLAQHPEMGRVVPEEQQANTRELVLHPYRIIYRVLPEDHVIAVACIWHGARGVSPVTSKPAVRVESKPANLRAKFI